MNIPADFKHLMLVDTDFEKILANPILDIAARFWDEQRYRAFKDCYRSMREVDDFIDSLKTDTGTVSRKLRDECIREIQNWTEDVSAGSSKPEMVGLMHSFVMFNIPRWPWQRLAKAMIYDLDHNGFKSFTTFLRYCEGAAIAPAAIFVHLCGVKNTEPPFEKPEFDIRKYSRALALFSYLVHIMRDFEKDQLRNLNYFADDILQKCGLDKFELNEMVRKKIFDERVTKLFSEYKRLAAYYQSEAKVTFKFLLPKLEPNYQLSLHIIYALYTLLFEKIDPKLQSFSETDLSLSPAEVQKCIDQTVSAFRPV